jgi:hypothetical protein
LPEQDRAKVDLSALIAAALAEHAHERGEDDAS